jgi:hypothetical protein
MASLRLPRASKHHPKGPGMPFIQPLAHRPRQPELRPSTARLPRHQHSPFHPGSRRSPRERRTHELPSATKSAEGITMRAGQPALNQVWAPFGRANRRCAHSAGPHGAAIRRKPGRHIDLGHVVNTTLSHEWEMATTAIRTTQKERTNTPQVPAGGGPTSPDPYPATHTTS